MTRLILAAATVAGLLTALPAAAQFQKPEDAVKYRKAAFTVMATHFGRMGAMVQGRVPYDAAVATANAEVVADMAQLPYVAFVEGTVGGSDKGAQTQHLDRTRQVRRSRQEAAGRHRQAAGCGQDQQPGPAQGGVWQCGWQLQGLPRQLPQSVERGWALVVQARFSGLFFD